MQKPNLKIVLLAIFANLAPLATGTFHLITGNILTGITVLAGAAGSIAIQIVNAETDARIQRAPVTARWYFSRFEVWIWLAFWFSVAGVLFFIS